ncbi:MAG: hypothetical protein LUQ09_04015 [Methanomassiliicoccales archaeon]|nr:hypothetical protein [Methanomassiliicoccales archaeon]
MAKVVMVPKKSTTELPRSPVTSRCSFEHEEGSLIFNCQGCDAAMDAPVAKCIPGIRCALETHLEAKNVVLQGEQHIWIRENGLESMRSLISSERSWEEFRSIIRSLPCFRPLPMDRVSRYLERARDGRMELFCKGDGTRCDECLRMQELALDSLSSDRRRLRRTMATDRFRITDVKGGSS